MEEPLLVSVDADSGFISIYGKSVVRVPFSEIQKIRPLLAGRTVRYISEVTETQGEEIIYMVSEMAPYYRHDPSVTSVSEPTSDGRLWMYATGSGYLNLANMSFQGPVDFKRMDRIGYDIAEKDSQVGAMLKKGLLRIVNTNEMSRLKKSYARKLADYDKSLSSSMIIDTSVKNLNLKNMSGARADVPEMEVDGDPDIDFETEEMKIIRMMQDNDEGIS